MSKTMESPLFLSPNPNSDTLSNSDYTSDYISDMYDLTPPVETTPTRHRKSTKKVMLEDNAHANLISWNTSGASFSVCNAKLFSKEVLPAHFKHNNFSSFVRLLNMYGFHKISKSPRGQRSNENEIWEFSHAKFIKGRPDLLQGIKRKAMDSELMKREAGDIQNSFAMLQMSQTDLIQQFYTLQENFSNLLLNFEESKKIQQQQELQIRRLSEAQGIPLPQQPSMNQSLQRHRRSTSTPSFPIAQQEQQTTNEPFKMLVTTPVSSSSGTISTSFGGYPSSTDNQPSISYPKWPNQPIIPSRSKLGNPLQQQQQQQQQSDDPNIIFSPMSFHTAANTPLPPSPMLLASPDLGMSPDSSEDSLGSFAFHLTHPDTLDPTLM
ncbi:HSF-type DNA-binding-domain-containing protein [Halteromyces radiatus]|uniref:HSF-type DNA-binding-domain-containing protein n=1 Tax=Halteromyces radiatus TaxID=101107 RepID=UPI00221EE94E|nr:HSF-type DNA-binding-domain-containing protein [Halteromyces radiatus]KAI8089697.1 HSF-type DNA-binding-domain-containing protein [Halteromyces radiatus]